MRYPKYWQSVNLFELCQPKQWKTISIKELLPDGYTVYGANGPIGFYNEFTHEHPTLMITCRGATCGNLHVSTPFSYINGNAMALDNLATDVCSQHYLRYFLAARGFKDVISGSAQPQITQDGLRVIAIPLAPLPEQKRIADKLDATLARVDACRERLARVAPILKRFRQSVLAAAVSGRLTADWRAQQAGGDNIPLTTESPDHPTVIEPASGYQAQTRSPDAAERNPGSNAASPSDINPDSGADAPASGKLAATGASIHVDWTYEGWPCVPISTVCESGRVITYGVIKLGEEAENGVPCLRTSNVRWLTIELDGLKKISQSIAAEYSRTILMGGEILVNVRGTLGGVAIVSPEMRGWNVSREVAVVPVDKNKILPEYAAVWIASNQCQQWLTKVEKGVAYTGVNLEDLRNLPIAIPKHNEQKEIVRRVESLFAFADRLEARLAAAQTAAEQLTPALLAKAFRGELVPQDPADEPASELLQRLAASRASADKPKRSRTPRQPA